MIISEADEGRHHVMELLEQEIQCVMGMEHPNIIKFYQCVYDNEYLNIVMELSRGKPLSSILEDNIQLSESECQVIMR